MQRIEVIQKDGGLLGDPAPVAVGLLNDSVRLLDELASWKASSHRELLEDAALPKAMLWPMCMLMLLISHQGAASGACSRCGRLRAAYVASHFQDDLALAGAFTRQILLHGQGLSLKGAIEDLSDQVAKLGTKAHTTSGEIKAAVKRVKGLEVGAKKLKGKQ